MDQLIQVNTRAFRTACLVFLIAVYWMWGSPFVSARGASFPHVTPVESEVLALKDSDVTLQCKLTGSAMPDEVTWYKDGKEVTKGSSPVRHPNGTYTARLNITSAQYNDTGLYTCTVQNQYGASSGNITLTVKGIPAMPANIRVNLTYYDVVKVSWVPGYNGGSAVVFSVQFRMNTTTTWESFEVPETTTHKLLTRPSEKGWKGVFVFRVTAVNQYGPSEASEVQLTLDGELPEERVKLLCTVYQPGYVIIWKKLQNHPLKYKMIAVLHSSSGIFKDGFNTSFDGRVFIGSNGSLRISYPTAEDSGYYMCQVQTVDSLDKAKDPDRSITRLLVVVEATESSTIRPSSEREDKATEKPNDVPNKDPGPTTKNSPQDAMLYGGIGLFIGIVIGVVIGVIGVIGAASDRRQQRNNSPQQRNNSPQQRNNSPPKDGDTDMSSLTGGDEDVPDFNPAIKPLREL